MRIHTRFSTSAVRARRTGFSTGAEETVYRNSAGLDDADQPLSWPSAVTVVEIGDPAIAGPHSDTRP